MQAANEGWFELITGCAARRHALPLLHRRRTARARTRPRASNPRTCTARARSSIPAHFDWQDGDWRGRPWEEAVIYELHVGAFTPEGTFAAVDRTARLSRRPRRHRDRADAAGGLSRARATGATTACCRSRRTAATARPEELKRLVQAAHARGLMVFLDVVYNHFGPEGNYLHVYAPQFFTERHHTPWGAAINFDGERSAHGARLLHPQRALLAGGVPLRRPAPRCGARDRRRLAARHPRGARRARARRTRARAARPSGAGERRQRRALPRARCRRPAALVRRAVERRHPSRAARAADRRERRLLRRLSRATRLARSARCLAEGLRLPGRAVGLPRRRGARRAERAAAADGLRLLPAEPRPGRQPRLRRAHRARWRRPRRCAPPPPCLLLAPSPPLLFMGEEFAAATPFLFFCDFDGELAAGGARGRRREFARFAALRRSRGAARAFPIRATARPFARSRLDWESLERTPHARVACACYRELLALRAREIVPRLARHRPGMRAASRVDGARPARVLDARRRRRAAPARQSRRRASRCRRRRRPAADCCTPPAQIPPQALRARLVGALVASGACAG